MFETKQIGQKNGQTIWTNRNGSLDEQLDDKLDEQFDENLDEQFAEKLDDKFDENWTDKMDEKLDRKLDWPTGECPWSIEACFCL